MLYNRNIFDKIRVIIHRTINRNDSNFKEEDSKNKSNKAILFCNPNGVFIQYFGMDN